MALILLTENLYMVVQHFWLLGASLLASLVQYYVAVWKAQTIEDLQNMEIRKVNKTIHEWLNTS